MRWKGLSRRSLLRAGVGAAGVWGMGSAAAVDADVTTDTDGFDPATAETKRLGPLDVTGTDVETRLVTVPASHADPTSAGIGPGSPLFMRYTALSGGERANFIALCTANFVWKDVANDYGSRQNFNGYYLGAAGHCFNPLGGDDPSAPRKWASQTAGGDYPARADFTEDLEDGDGVDVSVCINCIDGGATLLFTANQNPRIETVELGDVVYAREENVGANTEAVGFDFGIVEIPADAENLVKPAMPVWDGPETVDRFDDAGTSEILQYGNGVGAGETIATKNRAGTGAFHFEKNDAAPEQYTGDGDYTAWYATLPAAPGDSGSGVQTPGVVENGPQGYGAAGNLTHLAIAAGVDTSIPQAGAGITGGTPVRESITMVREDTRLVLSHQNHQKQEGDPFDRPLGDDASFGTETEVKVTKDGPDSIDRVQGAGDPDADVTIDDRRLQKAKEFLKSEKRIRNPIKLELVTPEQWERERNGSA